MDLLDLPQPPFSKRLRYGPLDSQFGELRLPDGDGPHPVVVGIHGGWWRAAHGLETHSHLCAALTSTGIATWNIEYRRIGEEGGWEATLSDVQSALDHLIHIAVDCNIDLGRIVPVGFSAGGQLALWVAARSRTVGASRRLQVKGAVSLAGAVDLIRCADLGLSQHVVAQFLGGTPEEVPVNYAQASPAELLPIGIPHSLIHGTADTSVPHEISERYHARAEQHGDPCDLVLLPDVMHFELIDPRTPTFEVVLARVNKHLQST